MQTRAHNCRAVTYRDTAVQVPGKWTRHRLMYCVRLRRWARHQQPAKYPCAAMTQQPASTYTLRRADCSTELCSAQRSLIQCRWVYEGKKIWDPSWPTVASRYVIALIWAIERCNPLNVTAKELCLTAITPVQTAGSLLPSLSYCAVTAIN